MMRVWRLSLKMRLMLLVTVLIGAFCLAAGTYIVKRAQTDIRGEVYSASDLIQHYLEAQLQLAEESWRKNAGNIPNLQLTKLSDIRHVEVYFYNAVGTMLETSAGGRAHAPEAPFWFVWLVQRSFTPIADQRRFVGFDGFAIGVLVIHPDPAFEIDEVWNVTRGLLGLLILFALLVNGLIGWAVGRALRPLGFVRTALSELSAGRFSARLAAIDLPELAGISGEFNHMAATLERSTAENHQLTRRLMQIQEDERQLLARELHDEIGQCVTAIHADAVTIHRVGASADPVIRESATAIIEVASRIKNMVRGMLQRLRPAVIDRQDLGTALRELTAAFRQRNPHTSCTLEVGSEITELGGEPASALYRVVQEGMTNVARHANAARVSIRISSATAASGDGALVAAVLEDDGVGFDSNTITKGFGLLGMRERVAGLGGTLTIDSAAGGGTRLYAELPWVK
ncbi:MAG: histidine kinase [Pseudomonadota bacterium]|nr:histidine kinase [Pseudomonadota bacterium]